MCPKDIIRAGEMQKKNTLESPPVIHKTLCVVVEIEPGTSNENLVMMELFPQTSTRFSGWSPPFRH